MKAKEGLFSAADGTRLFFRAWVPHGKPKAAVIVVHGHGDHSGGMETISRHLVVHDYAVYAFDLRGHGKSPGTRGFIRTWREYRQDMHAFRMLVCSEHPGLPLFLVGHSLGALICLDYCLYHGTGVAGLAAISPAISFRANALDRALIHLMCLIKPDYTVAMPGRRSGISRARPASSGYYADPLRHNTVTPGLGRGIMLVQKSLLRQAHTLRLPILLQYGLEDGIASPMKLRSFFQMLGSAEKQRIEYVGMAHRPFDEPGYRAFLADLLGWLEKRVKAGE